MIVDSPMRRAVLAALAALAATPLARGQADALPQPTFSAARSRSSSVSSCIAR
jgi:hypothetical protein